MVLTIWSKLKMKCKTDFMLMTPTLQVICTELFIDLYIDFIAIRNHSKAPIIFNFLVSSFIRHRIIVWGRLCCIRWRSGSVCGICTICCTIRWLCLVIACVKFTSIISDSIIQTLRCCSCKSIIKVNTLLL